MSLKIDGFHKYGKIEENSEKEKNKKTVNIYFLLKLKLNKFFITLVEFAFDFS